VFAASSGRWFGGTECLNLALERRASIEEVFATRRMQVTWKRTTLHTIQYVFPQELMFIARLQRRWKAVRYCE
jgi:hypothetical protein